MGVGKVPEEVEGGHKRSLRVTMTTLRAAPTRHLQRTSVERGADTYQNIVQRGGRVGGKKQL